MKKIILVRHAKTEQIYDNSKSDFERKLLPRGHKDAIIIAEQLKSKGYFPDLFITSKAKRAKQTAKIFADHLNHQHNFITEQFIYSGYTTGEMINYLSKQDDNYKTIIVFGHNPDIANFTINLVNVDLWDFPTCCTIVINFDIDSWSALEARSGKTELYIYPKMFKE